MAVLTLPPPRGTEARTRAARAGQGVAEKLACRSSAETRDRVGRGGRGRAPARGPKRIERIHRAPPFHKDGHRVRRTPAASPGCSLLSATPRSPSASFHSRRRHFPARAPYLARPLSLSLPVSDRVPLFRVLYYFFYQSARFQDALRHAESCAINHEM